MIPKYAPQTTKNKATKFNMMYRNNNNNNNNNIHCNENITTPNNKNYEIMSYEINHLPTDSERQHASELDNKLSSKFQVRTIKIVSHHNHNHNHQPETQTIMLKNFNRDSSRDALRNGDTSNKEFDNDNNFNLNNSNNNGSNSNISDNSHKICRICFEKDYNETNNTLLHPCKCTGSVKYIHEHCLHEWINKMYFKNKQILHQVPKCELCSYEFDIYYQFELFFSKNKCKAYVKKMIQECLIGIFSILLGIVLIYVLIDISSKINSSKLIKACGIIFGAVCLIVVTVIVGLKLKEMKHIIYEPKFKDWFIKNVNFDNTTNNNNNNNNNGVVVYKTKNNTTNEDDATNDNTNNTNTNNASNATYEHLLRKYPFIKKREQIVIVQ